MNPEKLWLKAKYVMRRDGSLLTHADLPCAKTKRWHIGRKGDVVDAVRGGLMSAEDACLRYSLTLEEFFAWQIAVDRRRPEAFRTESAKAADGRKSLASDFKNL